MKLTFLFLFTSVTVGLAGDAQTNPGQAPLPEIRTQHRDSISNGKVIASIETVYRGNDRVLDTVKYKVARGDYGIGGGFRIYRVGGKPVLFEEDYKGDGNVTVRVLGRSDDPEAFEAFNRKPFTNFVVRRITPPKKLGAGPHDWDAQNHFKKLRRSFVHRFLPQQQHQ